jgi:hypothetical protein
LLLTLVIDLRENSMKIPQRETVAEYASVQHQHHHLGVLEDSGVGFGKVGDQLVDPLDLGLLQLHLLLLHAREGCYYV